MITMFVKPANPNAIIRDPHTRIPLPAEGGRRPRNSFWLSRLRDGSAVIATPVETVTANHIGNEPIAPLTTRGGK